MTSASERRPYSGRTWAPSLVTGRSVPEKRPRLPVCPADRRTRGCRTACASRSTGARASWTAGRCWSAARRRGCCGSAPGARALVARDGSFTVADPTSAALARRLLDTGVAHPVDGPAAAAPAAGAVTVVVPVRDRADGAGPAAGGAAVRSRRAGRRGRRLGRSRRHGRGGAPGGGARCCATRWRAARPRPATPDWRRARRRWWRSSTPTWSPSRAGWPRCSRPSPIRRSGWRRRGSSRFRRSRGWLGRYEAVRSSLDLGVERALVVPRSRVAYVPSAALLVRRAAVGAGFDERMRVAEDVDLVLRLHAAGWRLRYEPAARVAHEHRVTAAAWWLRKAYYGTGAAPLALRHRGAVPPLVLSPWSAAVGALLLLGRPRAVLAAGGGERGGRARLSRRLDGVRRPRALAARLVGLGLVGAVAQTADAVTRHYWPARRWSPACCSARARRTVAAVAVVEGARRLVAPPGPRPAHPARSRSATCSRAGSTTSRTAGACGGARCATGRSSRCGLPDRAAGCSPSGLVRTGDKRRRSAPLLRVTTCFTSASADSTAALRTAAWLWSPGRASVVRLTCLARPDHRRCDVRSDGSPRTSPTSQIGEAHGTGPGHRRRREVRRRRRAPHAAGVLPERAPG